MEMNSEVTRVQIRSAFSGQVDARRWKHAYEAPKKKVSNVSPLKLTTKTIAITRQLARTGGGLYRIVKFPVERLKETLRERTSRSELTRQNCQIHSSLVLLLAL